MWKQGKEEYYKIRIPDNLESMVESALEEKEEFLPERGKMFIFKKARIIAVIAAVVCVAFLTGVRCNESFALAASQIPFIRGIVELVTSQQYTKENEQEILTVSVPKIEGKITGGLEEVINNEIRKKINEITKEAEQRAAEYKEAYIQTGGEEQDYWKMEIQVDYDIKCQNEEYLSFKIWKTESLASCYTENYFYNIDLEVGKELTLRDLLGPSYKEIANKAVREGIEKRLKEDKDAMFYGYSQGESGADDLTADCEFKSIEDNQSFYINNRGKIVLVFEKYSIAPGYMGEVEFELENELQP